MTYHMNREGTIHDLLAIGNAIVDIVAHVDDGFILAEGMSKGHTGLIDEARMLDLYRKVKAIKECSGGSAANTAAAMAELGSDIAFIGRVFKDEFGGLFTRDMNAIGVKYDTPPAPSGRPTACCIVCVTPDAERTMNTYIGASAELKPGDIDAARVESSAITYIEGYLWDEPDAKDALRYAINTARGAKRKVALTLSDTFCVNRHRKEFLELVTHEVDILFANESEALALFETSNMSEAIRALAPLVEVAAVTRSEQGAIVLHNEEDYYVPADLVSPIVDATGAGDLFAAGFLHGLLSGWDLVQSAKLGHRCAGHIIQQYGARAEFPLKALLAA